MVFFPVRIKKSAIRKICSTRHFCLYFDIMRHTSQTSTLCNFAPFPVTMRCCPLTFYACISCKLIWKFMARWLADFFFTTFSTFSCSECLLCETSKRSFLPNKILRLSSKIKWKEVCFILHLTCYKDCGFSLWVAIVHCREGRHTSHTLSTRCPNCATIIWSLSQNGISHLETNKELAQRHFQEHT